MKTFSRKETSSGLTQFQFQSRACEMRGSFDASQYAFFGGGDAAALDGGLGDGALDVDEGPVADGAPVEEVEITNDDDDEALAEAVMARLALGAGGGAGAAPMPHQQLTMPHPPVPPFAPVRVPGIPLCHRAGQWHVSSTRSAVWRGVCAHAGPTHPKTLQSIAGTVQHATWGH
jgi:hypothetical protein